MCNYLNLKAGAPARLCILKNRAAYTNAPDVNLPPSRRFADWRAAREFGFNTRTLDLCAGYNVENAGTPYEKRSPVWSTFAGPRFRAEAKIHEMPDTNMRHSGWYADADCSATICGIVARLPHDRWMAGYYSSENGERVYLPRIFDELQDAASYADDEARRQAEGEKEYSERYQAAHALDDEIEKLESDVRELFPMRHHARARREMKEVIPQLRTARARRADEYSDIDA
jgi:hypothetical protein